MSHSSFTDRRGQTWSIPELLCSDLPRAKRWAEVSRLIQDAMDDERWGPDGGTVREAVERARQFYASGRHETRSADDETDHAARIAAIAASIDEGWEPDPLVIGPDGGLWDGLHRLCGMYLVGKKWATVYDYCSARVGGIGDIDTESVAHLSVHMAPDNTNQGCYRLLAWQFRTATGYPHCYITDFLEPIFADKCAEALVDLSWKRHETDFFTQDEYSLTGDDTALPVVLQQLASFLLGEPLMNYMKCISGNPLLERPEAVIHCMRPGDYVGVHNDFRPQGERLRCVIYLGQKEPDMRHGVFIALGDAGGDQVLDMHIPIHNSAVLFEISPRSYHVVTEIEEELRYCVVLSYYERVPQQSDGK